MTVSSRHFFIVSQGSVTLSVGVVIVVKPAFLDSPVHNSVRSQIQLIFF